MATVAHYIRSHYDPEDREKLEKETGQHDEPEHGVDPDAEWQREAAQIERRRLPPPRFVPATISDVEWRDRDYGSSTPSGPAPNPLGSTVSGWYRSMTGQESRTPSVNRDLKQMAPALSSTQQDEIGEPPKRRAEIRNKNNWFIMKAIESEPSSSPASPAPTLADILARDPPPLPSEGKFTPPAFLGIGPANKGFGMLQRAGWNEGEPLGPDVIRRKPVEDLLLRNDGDMIRDKPSTSTFRLKGKSKAYPIGHNVEEVKVEDFDDVSELRKVEVIDLTLSDSDEEGEEEEEEEEEDDSEGLRLDEEESSKQGASTDLPQVSSTVDNTPYARKALITPIATVLKSDRLGIGLKAKTVGPHKASQKCVTHGAAALAAHARTAEEARKKKALYGRGRRGFERERKRDEEHRQALLSQLKSPW